jgi:Xaa-Pro aminopeptidase
MNYSLKLKKLIEAENMAKLLFVEATNQELIISGKTEREVSDDIYSLAFKMFGIKKYWHKRVVRSGKNTIYPYESNPANLTIQTDDVVFIDFGPVFDNWEADLGRTFIIGSDSNKIKLNLDIEAAWKEGCHFYENNRDNLTGADLFYFTHELAFKYGWKFKNEHCGHLVGNFPHEKLIGDELFNYLHPSNNYLLSSLDKNGEQRFWIYEIHFVEKNMNYGGFFEQLLLV